MRKRWRKWVLNFNIILGVILTIVVSIMVIFPQLEGDPPSKSLPWYYIPVVPLYFIFPNYIFYYCAYQKGGSRLLTFYLFAKPAETLWKGILLAAISPFLLLVFLPSAMFYFLNWHLRKINLKLKQHISYPEEYKKLTESFLDISIREELEDRYSLVIRQWPQFERQTTLLYRKHLTNSK